MTLSELCNQMFRFSPTSDAWKDFADDCRESLSVASLTEVAGVDTHADFSDFWMSVAAGDSGIYEPDGSRSIIN